MLSGDAVFVPVYFSTDAIKPELVFNVHSKSQ